MNPIDDFQSRGLIHQATDLDGLKDLLQNQKITFYAGFDPTADSLHIGNLLIITSMMRMQMAGHSPLAIVGGATGLIGDPSGKESERTLNTRETVEQWSAIYKRQLGRFLDFDSKSNPARVLSNYEWLGEMNLLGFMRDIGKHFPIGAMLAKDSVKSRLDAGISYAEFSYMVLQASDFHHLHEKEGCQLQIGGSDQWGNITAGCDLIRRRSGAHAYGMTLPLITDSAGIKLGKTGQGTVWLDADRTSPYQFYQYWINLDDSLSVTLLRYFTFLPMDEIAAIEADMAENAWKRNAQRTLAEEVTRLVHGQEALDRAANISRALFSGEVDQLAESEIEEGLRDVPTFDVSATGQVGLISLLADAGISPSKRRAREDVQNGAILLNGQRVKDPQASVGFDHLLHGKYLVIRRGKSSYHLIRWLS